MKSRGIRPLAFILFMERTNNNVHKAETSYTIKLTVLNSNRTVASI